MAGCSAVLLVVCILYYLPTSSQNSCSDDRNFKFPRFLRETTRIYSECSLINILPDYMSYISTMMTVVEGLSLEGANKILISHNWNVDTSLQLNSCVSAARNREFYKQEDVDFLFYTALALDPLNEAVIKNFAFLLEIRGCERLSDSLLHQASRMLPEAGLQLQQAFVSSTSLHTEQDAFRLFHRIVTRALSLLQQEHPSHYVLHPFYHIRAIQASYHYFGISPGVIAELYCRVLYHQHAQFLAVNIALQSILPPGLTLPPSQLKPKLIGVVSEFDQNSSPGLCLARVVHRIAEQMSNEIQFVYFDRKDNTQQMSYFKLIMYEISSKIVILDNNDLEGSAAAIAQQNVDVLLYISLPTEKYTNMLGLYRLAPYQIQFGIGHPISSGSSAIDYSIVSQHMLYKYSDIIATELSSLSIDKCLAYLNSKNVSASELTLQDVIQYPLNSFGRSTQLAAESHPCCLGASGSLGVAYTEQLVQFDSLGYYLHDSMDYSGDSFDPLEFPQSNCSSLSEWIARWGLADQLQAEHLGCDLHQRTVSLYFGLQIPRKYHPVFDEAIVKIISTDRHAKIIMMNNSKDLLNRFHLRFDGSLQQLKGHFIFTPRLPNSDYLRLLSMTSVFLNPFPFGAGITSSDALSMCVPVVVLPSHISVLQLALAQVSRLGNDIAEQLVADSIDDYVNKAIRVANSESNSLIRRQICASKHKLYGREVLLETVAEWQSFLTKILT